MRFFDTNFLYYGFPGTTAASSNSVISSFPFNEEGAYPWKSNGQAVDGNSIYLERALVQSIPINRIFVQDTNISNLTIQVDLGAGYINLSAATSFNLIKSVAGDNYFYELNNTINIFKIKLIGSNTIISNQDKFIRQVLGFKELGRIKNNDDITPTRNRIQVISKLNSGKSDIINKGSFFEFKVKFKAHYKVEDNSLLELLSKRDQEVWLWINDNQEAIFAMPQEPYKFGNIYKVAQKGNNSTQYAKNKFYSGIDLDLTYTEVA